jgi:hypothetical protein
MRMGASERKSFSFCRYSYLFHCRLQDAFCSSLLKGVRERSVDSYLQAPCSDRSPRGVSSSNICSAKSDD